MVATHLCALCRPWVLPGVDGIAFGGEPPHCYGGSDHVNPGVLGGYRCSCKCREEKPTARGVRAPGGGTSLPQQAQNEGTP